LDISHATKDADTPRLIVYAQYARSYPPFPSTDLTPALHTTPAARENPELHGFQAPPNSCDNMLVSTSPTSIYLSAVYRQEVLHLQRVSYAQVPDTRGQTQAASSLPRPTNTIACDNAVYVPSRHENNPHSFQPWMCILAGPWLIPCVGEVALLQLCRRRQSGSFLISFCLWGDNRY
jgi:hypothetical protein